MKKRIVLLIMLVMLIFMSAWTIGGRKPTRPVSTPGSYSSDYYRPIMDDEEIISRMRTHVPYP